MKIFLELVQKEWQKDLVVFFKIGVRGEMGAHVAKIFFFIIVALGLYSLFSSFFDSKKEPTAVLFIFSAAISFLLIAYITPEEIYGILVGYTALGLTLIVLLPLLIMFLITYKAAESGKPQIMVLQYVGWIIFSIFLAYKTIAAWGANNASGSVIVLMLISFGVALGFSFFNKKILDMITKKYMWSEQEAASRTFSEAGRATQHFAEAERNAAER
ncbi:MAG: hypothetical protein ACOCRO_11100 [Halanaerobiales bacterium]